MTACMTTKVEVLATFGRLEILFLPNPLQWRGGYCLTTDVDELSLTRHVIIIAAGALGSLVVTVVPFYCALVFHANDLLLWALLVPACAAVLGLGSLIPRKHSMQVGSDGIIYSDGARLLQLLSMRGYHREWMRISRHYREKQYGEAARLLEDLLGRVQKADIHRLAIIVHIMANDMRKADELSERLRARGGMTWGDFVNAGLIKCYLGEHDACLADFERASARDRNNATIHNARGFAMSCMERYAEAIADAWRGELKQRVARAVAANAEARTATTAGNKAA